MYVAGTKAGRAAFHQEAVNTIIGFGPDDGDIGNTAIGNPHFGAIQDVRIAIASRCCAHTAGVAARIRLGQPEAAYGLAARHTWQPALLLLLGTELVDGEHSQRALHRDERPQTTIARLQLLARQAVANRAQPGAAVALKVHPQQT